MELVRVVIPNARAGMMRDCSISSFRVSQRFKIESSRMDRIAASSSAGSSHPATRSKLTGIGADAAVEEEDLSIKFWMGGKNLGLHTPYRKLRRGTLLVAAARAKTKKGQKDVPPVIPQRDLLAQVRNRKKLSWLLREQQLSREDSEVEKVWPFWRKKEKEDLAARAVTIRIRAVSKRKQLHQVFDLLEKLKLESKTLCIIIMNAVVEACVHCNDMERAVAVYQDMPRPGNCGVDNITYGILLKGLGQAHRLDDAFELLDTIEAGTAPGNPILSDVHLNTLVNACVEAGDSLRARGAFLRYRSSVQGSMPSILTYNPLMKGCARSDNPLEALKLREEMLVHELQPQRLTHNTLIFACVRGGDMEKALELFTEMKVCSPNNAFNIYFMTACLPP